MQTIEGNFDVPNDIDNSKKLGLVGIVCKLIAYVFHPLFIPTYFFSFLMWRFPYEFPGLTPLQLKLKLFSVFWMTAFFPAFAVFLLWKLQFSRDIYLLTQKERIIPYFICMFFYWWMYYLSRNFTDQPAILKSFFMGIFISSSVGVFLNNYLKISLHGIAMGALFAVMLATAFYYHQALGLELSITLLMVGLVGSSRLLLGSHNPLQLYLGIGVGVISQWVAYIIML